MIIEWFAKLIIFLPFISFALVLSLHSNISDRVAQTITCSLMGFSFLFASILFFLHIDTNIIIIPWLNLGNLQLNWGIKIDALSSTMMWVVTFISTLVHIYSIGYMHNDKSIPRFMALLSFFTFTMLLLVSAPNLLQLFVGWEGVGVASYFLIGFWYEKPATSQAAFKAFLVNRVGDLGLILASILIFWHFNSLNFDQILNNADHVPSPYIDLIGIFLLIGAMGKSAQFGLHVWLADAMEGPTPVSALIHAATMVTAGIFLLIRFSALLEYSTVTKDIILYVGIITSVFAATTAITQNDIKRIIAYSTCSQLGLMIMSCGCSAYTVAFFHLFTHAFFKALLFLSSGAVIHAMSDEQNIQKMGGLWRSIPITYLTMWIGSLALSGIPYFAGYYSKELILTSAYYIGGTKGNLVYYTGCMVTILTALYSFRLIFLVFHGHSKANEHVEAHIHEAPNTMIYPMIILSIMAIISGYIGNKWFIEEKWLFSWKEVVYHGKNHTDHLFLPLLCGIFGILVATYFYFIKTKMVEILTSNFKIIYNFLLNRWYIDKLYQVIFVNFIVYISKNLNHYVEKDTIDRYGPNGITLACIELSQKLKKVQTGYVYHYTLLMIAGLALILLGYIYQIYIKHYCLIAT